MLYFRVYTDISSFSDKYCYAIGSTFSLKLRKVNCPKNVVIVTKPLFHIYYKVFKLLLI